tara:strand:+ start:4615 stop:6444 length:1830 start_codon:yes stop_codon:yes gene_type:complete
MKRFLILIFINISLFELYSQEILFPVNPNNQNFLSGNLGELRGDHFHMGIDIKTFGRINEPIYAANDGYVERIFISGTGYGKALYLKHGNGTKTVYAHLNKFNKEIDIYTTDYQYRNKKFKANLFPGKRFYYKRGELIGYSGNSGSSGGPHLHFELRDSLDNVYDPLKYKFSEIKDNRRPIINKIAFKTLNIESRVNNEFGIQNLNILDKSTLKNNSFQANGKIGISILTYDKLDGYENKVGIKKIRLFVNDTLIIDNEINFLSYSETKNVKRYIEYDIFKKNRQQFIKTYQDDGNKLNFHQNINDGIINVFKNENKKIKIEVFDSFDNTESYTFYLKSNYKKNDLLESINLFENNYYNIDNTLIIRSNIDNRDSVEFKENNDINLLEYSFIDDNYKYYLVDLRKNLPSKFILDDSEINLNFLNPVYKDKDYKFENDDFEIFISKSTVFDTLYFQFFRDDGFNFKNSHPIKGNINITFKTNSDYDKIKSKVYSMNGDKPSYIGGKWIEKNVSFSTTSLTNFKILVDTIKPEIKPITINQDRISFIIDDDLSGIKSYEASIDDEWILFEYDNKNKIIISKKKDSNKPFKGNFVLVVTDNAENKKIYKLKI